MIYSRPLLGQRTAEELLAMAGEMEAMALTATTASVQQALERLAVRYRALAVERTNGGTRRSTDATARATRRGT